VSSYDRRTRDRYRQVVRGVTGIAGLGALTLTGGLMGLAAGEAAQEQQDATPQEARQQQAAQPAEHRRTGLRERPYVTRVTTRYVTGGTVTNDPGPGGTVSSSGSGSGSSKPGPAPAPAPAPEPDPPPAPSSGS
jgi:hypothetical protein